MFCVVRRSITCFDVAPGHAAVFMTSQRSRHGKATSSGQGVCEDRSVRAVRSSRTTFCARLPLSQLDMPVPHILTWRVLGYYLCAAVIATSALWLNLRVYHAIRASVAITRDSFVQEWHEQDFSYLEDDRPLTFLPPSRHPRNVALVTEETYHYWPNTPQDWESMTPAGSKGFVRLGPQNRLFGVSMYHQLHCLGRLQQATAEDFDSAEPRKLDGGEVHHCLNYLRQTLLCAANVRLEPLTRDRGSGALKTDGIGLEHRCRDWTVVRREVEANFEWWRSEERMP
ncbi:hypothetical protein LXA43DRAFT_142224 [Ganoderma leucocontextum]|nr:hypothetical protein LXA43DRAFT_142224 [Ganoderma leucocontextum]